MECLKPIYLSKTDMYVPCGKCGFCGATRRSDWALRLAYEKKLHSQSAFVTLTYANPHLVWKDGLPQLHREHTQLFFKRLRKAGFKLRYYGVSEYGAKTYRPHYHLILFGDVPEEAIRKAWDYGQVHIGNVTEQSVMYCLSYMINKNDWRMSRRRVRPFNMMSRGRGAVKGIGSNYLTSAMISWHRSARKGYALLNGCKRHLPRYYKVQIFSRIDQVRMAVQAEKDNFRRMVKWIRDPARRRIKDPLALYERARRQMEKSIRFKAKENLTL